MPRFLPARTAAVLLILLTATPGSRGADSGMDFFEKRIRPLLVEHCYACHSAEAKKLRGGLFVDTRDGLRKGGDTGPAVVPNKPKESLLLKAVAYTDELRMPPKGKLPAEAIADLEKWIAMGAPDPRVTARAAAKPAGTINIEEGRKFWAYQPVKNGARPLFEIDRFLLAKREAKGIQPVGEADRVTLIRRAYFDLIGLPPTPAEVDAFLRAADAKPQAAYEELVDRLLASPPFGERWGRHWLDVARFAESSGGGRSLLFPDAWRYRDYVIGAFNADKPFDRFIVEQLAGDLLPAATPEQRHEQIVATAFLVLGPTNYERQDKDILEMDVIDEQLDTLGRAFLGQTIGCARCHDHKFDPIPTKDYYALAGILKSTQTLIHDNVSKWVELPLPVTGEQEVALKRHEAAVSALREQVRLAKAEEKKTGKVVAAEEPKGALAVSELAGIVLDDTHAKRVGAWKASKYGAYIGEGALYDDRGEPGEKTLTFVPEFPQPGKYEVRLAYVPHANRAPKVPVTILHLDGETTVHVNMQEKPAVEGRFVSLGTFRFDRNGQWFVMVSNEGTKGHVSVDAVQFLPEETTNGARVPSGQPLSAAHQTDSRALETELKRLLAAAPKRPAAMSVKEAAKIDDCHVCIRGNTHNRGEKVPRGFLQVATVGKAPTIPAGASGRRQLAEWVASADNPLTARVFVNRVWHWLFGAGLVRTVDTFGMTGEPPSHPELLDHLAAQFVRDGWSVKKLIRAIMLSQAYQLSSENQAAAAAIDPENRLLWRMNRRRLDAEALRDAILAVSGTLDRRAGGPTVRPGTASEYGYAFDDARRSVYTPVFRNRLLELFEVFDFADPNLVGGRRVTSTVATQALYLMNSPFVMEQARHAAKAALARPGDDAARLEHAYRTALGRLPMDRERELALAFMAGRTAAERQAAWEQLYQALFACIDFRYVN